MIEPFTPPNPMLAFREALERGELMKRALNLYREDVRARCLVEECVGVAMNMLPDLAPNERRDAYELAREAALILLTRVYFENTEIAELRAERDAFRRVAEQLNVLGPPALRWPTLCDSGSHPEGENGEAG